MKEITDAEAVKLLESEEGRGVLQAKTFVPRTIWYAVEGHDGKFRNQPFLTQGSYCNELEWDLAKEYEKKFAQLNKLKRAQYGEVKDMVENKDPLKTKILDIR